jgi:molybdopterin converting factor small subunit
MRVIVQYEAQARRAAGTHSETIDVAEAASFRDCIRHVGEWHGDPLKSILLSADGSIQPSLLVFVNDGHVVRGNEAALSDGDTLTLMTPISGG